jgi:hypothetical protein
LPLVRFQKIAGTISNTQPSRTFVDGVYCNRIEITSAAGVAEKLDRVFFTLKLAFLVSTRESGEFYFWNSHCYAFRSGGNLVEDIDGVRASYFKRDFGLLLLLAFSVVLLPVAVFVMAKRLLRAGTRHQMENFLST